MKKLFYIACIFALMFLISCAQQNIVLKPTGDIAKVVTRSKSEFVGEILAISDSTVYFNIQDGSPNSQMPLRRQIIDVRLDNLQSITIKDYSNRKWLGSIIGFEVLPAILLSVAGAIYEADSGDDVDVGNILLTFSIPAILNFILFEGSTPPSPKFSYPITPDELERLKKYASFPQGLTPVQLERLLAANTPVDLDLKEMDVAGKFVTISDQLGEVIDLEERNKYNLFPIMKGFQSAVLLKLPDGGYVFEITTLDETTGKENIEQMIQTESQIMEIRGYIKQFE